MSSAVSRVERAIAGARRLADPSDPLGIAARARLPVTTGLSPEGVELALGRCLELSPSPDEVRALVASTPPAPRAHVLLSAEPFVAAHRAIAIALAASEEVFVRASRREPHMASLLREAAGGFDLVPDLAPEPGDHVWAYGSDEGLASFAASLPPGVVLHGHGAGFGVAVVTAESDVDHAAAAVAEDVVVLDQRGCASPRAALSIGSAEGAERFARALASALVEAERRVPRGPRSARDEAEVRRYLDAARVAGTALAAGHGAVGVGDKLFAAPQQRCLHVARFATDDEAVRAFAGVATDVTVLGGAGRSVERLAQIAPSARRVPLGSMQRLPFDGPVDRRPWRGVRPSGARDDQGGV